MTSRLSVIDYAMALRLRDVADSKKPKFQLLAEEAARQIHPETFEHIDRSREERTLICDRCMGKETVLPKGGRVYSIEMFKMCICDDCAQEIRDGGPPLHPGYFEAARNLLVPFFQSEEVEAFVESQDVAGVVSALTSRWTKLQAKAPKGSPAKLAPVAAYLPGVFSALAALSEEKRLPEWWALPIEDGR